MDWRDGSIGVWCACLGEMVQSVCGVLSLGTWFNWCVVCLPWLDAFACGVVVL